ncbi:hypothetical protein ACFE04_030092 [Oxalis oulophora]
MNHCVPDFEIDDDYAIQTSSSSAFNTNRARKSIMQEDDIMELVWHNGQLAMHNQNQHRSLKNRTALSINNNNNKIDDAVLPTDQQQTNQQQQQQQQQHNNNNQLFMQEDEMSSWLHYPLNDCNLIDSSDFCSDLLYNNNPTPCVTTATATATDPLLLRPPQFSKPPNIPLPPPPQPPPPPPSSEKSAIQNFAYFARHKSAARPELELARPSSSKNVLVKESTTVVGSSLTPSVNINMSCGGARAVTAGTSSNNNGGRDVVDVTVTSSPGCSSASAEPNLKQSVQTAGNRKRKGRDTGGGGGDDAECQSEDIEFESSDTKKQSRGSTSTKRARAAEVHNLSERRRRDRINEKMKALQELIPRCNKSDKASMLDEAIEYLKSLQMQVQMMSMGCGMVPMMFPGAQQYMTPMGMGFGMGMGMDMGMSRPMMPFPNAMAGSAVLPPNGAAAHLAPRFPMPPFHMPAHDPSRIQAGNQPDPLLNPLGMQNPNQARIPNFTDPHQQYLSLHHMQLPQQQVLILPYRRALALEFYIVRGHMRAV